MFSYTKSALFMFFHLVSSFSYRSRHKQEVKLSEALEAALEPERVKDTEEGQRLRWPTSAADPFLRNISFLRITVTK